VVASAEDHRVRLQRVSASDFVVEAQAAEGQWQFVRLCHLDTNEDEPLAYGIYACSPTEAGGSVLFHRAAFCLGCEFHHHN
jgi:regulation of enolase protein 1 (concanavalin A-like superfamily)